LGDKYIISSKSRKGLVLFGLKEPNKYSWAILIGYLDQDPLIRENIEFRAISEHLYYAPNIESQIQEIPFGQYDFVIIAYSLLSVQIEQFQMFTTTYPQYFSKFHSNVITIAGGAHVRAKPESFLSAGIDFIIPGEGEIPFQGLLRALIREETDQVKNNPPPGVYSQYKHSFFANENNDMVQIGHAPPYSDRYRLFAPFEISRGCPNNCKYCQTACYSHIMRHAEVEDIIKWIEYGSRIKYDKIWFITPNAFAFGGKNGTHPNPQKLQELLSGIKNIDRIKQINFGVFPSEVRPEFITKEVLQSVIPYISNKYLTVGVQNASNHLLKSINRGHTFEDVVQAIEVLEKYNFKADLDFIFGLPGENEDDINQNIVFFEKIASGQIRNVRIHTHTFMPLPGTPFENEKHGTLNPRILKIIGTLARQKKAFGEHITQAGLVPSRFQYKKSQLK
jgi:B12-binding domain/radical SAM domain protein